MVTRVRRRWSWARFVVAAVLAVVDWVGVWRDDARLRWVGKPGVMVALIVAAAATDGAPSAVRAWFITALVLSLLGDVALLLADRWFIAGLTSFLLAHLAYIAGMVQLPLEWSVGVLVVPVAVIVIAPTLVRAVRDTSPDMVAPVIAYLGVISGMAITAWCTSEPWLIVAAMAFFTSDAMLGWGALRHAHAPATLRPTDRSGGRDGHLSRRAGLLRGLAGHPLTPPPRPGPLDGAADAGYLAPPTALPLRRSGRPVERSAA